MIEFILASPIIPMPIELRIFSAICWTYLAFDYRSNIERSIKLKRKKSTERQIFDGHNEVSSMIHAAVSTNKFCCLEFNKQMEIVRFINNRYLSL